jgi:hypothetical protein
VEAFGSATLTDEVPAAHAVSAFLTRDEIAGALADERDHAELLLDVLWDENGREEHGTIGITWSRPDLEALLSRASDDGVALRFDGGELSSALADVQAHGLRQKALVFAVAATGALGTGAGIANAMPSSETGPVTVPKTAPASPGGGILDVHAPSAADGAIAGGIALAVLGAAFATRRARPIQPSS